MHSHARMQSLWSIMTVVKHASEQRKNSTTNIKRVASCKSLNTHYKQGTKLYLGKV